MPSLCKLGLHMRCLDGCGMMGDSFLCLDCGQDKYPEVFIGYRRVIGTMGPQWWDEVARARLQRK